MTSELSQLLNKIEQTREAAEMNLHNHDYKTRQSAELGKNMAKKDLVKLVSDYKSTVGKRIAKIFLTGTTAENADKFVDLLKKEKLTVFHPTSLYTNIAASVFPKLSSGGLYSTPAFLQLCETCRVLGEHYVVFPTTPPKNTGTDTIVKNVQELSVIVKNAVRSAYRDTLAKAYIHEQVFKHAMDTRFTDKLLCVVVSDLTTEERVALSEVLFPEGVAFSVDLENEEPSRSHSMKLYRKLFETFKSENMTSTNGN